MEPISDFYCMPESEAEAREIVERAVAHGAKLNDRAGKFLYVGVLFGETRFLGRDEVNFNASRLEHLTLDQLRRQAPFVGGLSKQAKRAALNVADWDGSKSMVGFQWIGYEPYRSSSQPNAVLYSGEWHYKKVTKDEWQAARRALYFAGMLDKPGSSVELSTTSYGTTIEPTKPNRAMEHDSVSTDTTFESLKKAFGIFNLVYGTNIEDHQAGVFKYILDLVESVKREDSK